MHAAYLGLVHSHCRKIWRISLAVEGGEGTAILPAKDVPRPSDNVISGWLADIQDSPDDRTLRKSLAGCPKDVLWHICINNNIRSAGARKQLIDNIIGWVRKGFIRNARTLTLRKQYNRVDSASIRVLACATSQSQEEEGDDSSVASGSLASESNLDTLSLRLQEMTSKINQSFIEYRIEEPALANSNVKVLKTMCSSRGINIEGFRVTLAARLVEWVFRSY